LPFVTVETALGLDLAVAATLALFWGVGTGLAPAGPGTRAEPDRAGVPRFEGLDGLRGFLALAVLLHHGPVAAAEMRTGRWEVGSTFSLFLGRTPVNLFFMMTAFLFWSRALAAPGPLAVGPHLRARFFRVAPLYAVTGLLVLAIALALTGFRLHESPWRFCGEAVAVVFGLGMVVRRDLNGVPLTPINGGVTWTLAVEWIFYLALPVLSHWRTPRRFLALSLAAVPLWLLTHSSMVGGAVGMLYAGMLAAQVRHRTAAVDRLKGPSAAVVGLAGVLALPLLTDRPASPVALLAAAPLFLAVANGNALFGLLRTRGARHLGAISYGIYLLHGPLIFAACRALAAVIPPARWTGPLEWIMSITCGALVIPLAGWTYRRIEAPTIAFERRLRRAPAASTTLVGPSPREGPGFRRARCACRVEAPVNVKGQVGAKGSGADKIRLLDTL